MNWFDSQRPCIICAELLVVVVRWRCLSITVCRLEMVVVENARDGKRKRKIERRCRRPDDVVPITENPNKSEGFATSDAVGPSDVSSSASNPHQHINNRHRSTQTEANISNTGIGIQKNTMKSSVIILLLAFKFGVALSFNSRLRGFCFRSSSLPNLSQPPSQRRPTTSLLSLSSLPPDNDSSTSARIVLQKRRAFLSNFAASSLLPVITSVNPASVSAWGFPNNENGPLVYGKDDIMSPKEHGTTSLPVQENLRYGVSIYWLFCRLLSITDD